MTITEYQQQLQREVYEEIEGKKKEQPMVKVDGRKVTKLINDLGRPIRHLMRDTGLSNTAFNRAMKGYGMHESTLEKIASVLNIKADEIAER